MWTDPGSDKMHFYIIKLKTSAGAITVLNNFYNLIKQGYRLSLHLSVKLNYDLRVSETTDYVSGPV